MNHPRVSIVVPAYNAATTLGRCLESIEGDGFPRHVVELIVVDDASEDDTALVAAQYADVLVRLPDVPRGPAYARNRGAEAAHGELLLFVDADVVLVPGTLARLTRWFDEKPGADAAIGRYATSRNRAELVSTYANWRSTFLHGTASGRVATFWTACGAIRTHAFEAAGRFNEWSFSAPPAEDMELGRRLVAAGSVIELLPDLEVAHLRRWSLADLVARDCWQRGLRVGRLLNDMTVQAARADAAEGGSRVSRELVTLALMLSAAAALAIGAAGTVAAGIALAMLLLVAVPAMADLGRTLGFGRAVLALPMHLLCEAATGAGLLAGWLLAHLVGAPRPHPTVEALSEIGVRTWPPLPSRR